MSGIRDTAQRVFCTRDSRLDMLRDLAADPAGREPAIADEPEKAEARGLSRYFRWASRST